ncbi:MAG: precorrin-6y C5,15-methyltransferase (decarboxylating) subunit CbiE [Cohaesibacter sp.]|jgi:precorrin-6Y C5,15-methyltransferase (decarboxylating)|nr:precorrin-6y C5,15-methyltransferase (decarboxylating) subunit CbiE [Cohaesibacter sp.]
MSDPWLHIIGLTETGLSALPALCQEKIANADIIFGGPRHLALAGIDHKEGGKGQAWPIPFSIDPVLEHRGKQVVMLVSGDPFWFGAGSTIIAHLEPQEWVAHTAPSTFSLACAALGWRIEETRTFGLHAAPFERLLPALHHSTRILCLVRDGDAPKKLAHFLTEQNFGQSELTILERLGGPNERIRTCIAEQFDLSDIKAPVAVAINCKGRSQISTVSGKPDSLFANDGQITKRPVRALSLSALAPRNGETLWDLGAGSGSISAEWCLSGSHCKAIAVETRSDRLDNIKENISRFGLAPRMQAHLATLPDGLEDLPVPNAVFIGGGASQKLLEQLWTILPAGCRLVCNSVTLETESLFTHWQAQKGGELLRIELAEAAPLGSMRGWKPARPIIQWSVSL